MRTVLFALITAASIGGLTAASAQPAPLTDSYRKAKDLLDAAVVAHGGREALVAAGRIQVRMQGQDHWRNQSRKVAPPYDTEPWTGELRLDTDANRLVWTVTSRFPGGFRNANRTVLDGTAGYNADLRRRTHALVPNRTLDTQRGTLARLPHYLLLGALDNAASLRWLGPTRSGRGNVVDAITATTPGGPLTLGFDPTSKQLRFVLGVQADPLTGDAASETEFADYRRVGAIIMPGRRLTSVAGELTQEIQYSETSLTPSFPDSLLVPPAGSVALPTTPPPPETVRELAPGVWAVNAGGYWSLAVAFPDYVLAMEAPAVGTPALIERIKSLSGGKPIRYVVPTHHHDDHAGGMRSYIAEGTTIVTTPLNRGYFERMATATYSVRPDRQATAHATARFELLSGKRRVFGEGARVVEIHDIGPSPHADEMLIAWLPNEGIIYQGDLLNLPPDGTIYPNSANDTSEHFARWIEGRGWKVRTLVGAHMAPGDFTLLGRALESRTADP